MIMPNGSPKISRRRSVLTGHKAPPVTAKIRALIASDELPYAHKICMSMTKEDEQFLTDALKEAFPGIRFFDSGPNLQFERRMSTIEVAGLHEHFFGQQADIKGESRIHFLWVPEGWRPHIKVNEQGNKILDVRNEPYRGTYWVHSAVHELDEDQVGDVRAALTKAGVSDPSHTFRQRQGDALQRIVVPGFAELHVYSWDDVPETLAFRRKVFRLARKAAPYRQRRVDPVSGIAIGSIDPSISGWLGQSAAQRFINDPDFWPLFCGNPEKPAGDPGLLEAWAPDFDKG
jgi:hypothetical protein